MKNQGATNTITFLKKRKVGSRLFEGKVPFQNTNGGINLFHANSAVFISNQDLQGLREKGVIA